MGLLDTLSGLFKTRPVSLLASQEVFALVGPPTETEGISGTANYGGRLINEPNAELREQAGFGRAGTYQVGQWREIELTNPYVTAGLDFVMAPIADARIDIEPPNPEAGVPEAVSAAQVEFLKWALIQRFNVSQLVECASRGFLLSGFSLFEPVCEQAKHPSLPGGSGFTIRAIPERLPNSLHSAAWIEDDEGRLTGIRQQGPKGGTGEFVTPTIPAERALLFSWKRKGGNWAGESQLRSAWYIAAKVMPMLLKLTGVTLQREGAGVPVAVALDPNAPLSADQRAELSEVFAGLSFHEAGGVVMPAGWDIKWVFSPGANKGHVVKAWNDLGLVVLQQLGAQQMMLGTGETGSRSVGQVHDARSMSFVRQVLRFCERVLNGDNGEAHTGLVKRLIDWNWGPQAAYPRIKLTPQRPELQPDILATAAKTAKEAGLLTVTTADENSMRERLGFAPVTEEERSAALPSPAITPLQPVPLKASAQRMGWVPWRPLRASEANLKLSEMDAYFTARRDEFERKVKPVVIGMLAMAAPDIKAAMADGDPSEVAELQFDTTRLDQTIAKFLAEVRAAGGASVRDELSTGKPLTAAEEDDDAVAIKEADDVVHAQGKALQRRMTNRLRSELEREAIDVIRTGGDATEVVSRAVSRQLDTGAFKADAGYVTTKIYNVGRDEAARIMGGISEVEYSAILDNATCEACTRDDGTVAAFGSPEHDALVPPNRDCAGGDNCRCLLVMIPGNDAADGGGE